jgi:hypothetical protein
MQPPNSEPAVALRTPIDVDLSDEPPLGREAPSGPDVEGRSAPRASGPSLFLSPEQVVQRALFLSSVHKEDLISVAGPDGLAAMLTLCREGFDQVECVRQATCAGADEARDLLLIVGPMSVDELADTVKRTARLLRDDGVLIAQISGAAEEAVILPALAAAGFEAQFSLIDRSAGRLVLHRVRRAALMRRTA